MSQNPSSGFQNVISGAQGFLGGNQTAPTTQPINPSGGGFLNSAQTLLGGQPQSQYSQTNNTIDTAQAMMGHTGQGGPGIHGYIDKAQGLTGHQGPVGGVQGALNTVQGMQGLQQVSGGAQKSGLGGLATTAGGLLGQGQTGQTSQGGVGGFINQAQGLLGSGQPTHQTQPTSNVGGINSTIDTVQGFMGHTGQGGAGIQGTIDQAQGYLGQTGQLAGQGRTAQPTNIANTATRTVPQQSAGGMHGLMDKAKGLFGHTDTA